MVQCSFVQKNMRKKHYKTPLGATTTLHGTFYIPPEFQIFVTALQVIWREASMLRPI
jgi:hypothetical protein